MKTIRWAIFLLAWLGLLVCIVLLLNVTASNPTGRRYSSEAVERNGRLSSRQLGDAGERVLALDLDLPVNDRAGQMRCLCNVITYAENNPNSCNECLMSDGVTNYRIPDFVGGDFIAESKNVIRLMVADDDFMQISDTAAAARELDMKYWLYVRIDSVVHPAYYDPVRSTGGDIVYYFVAEPGYLDRIDRMALSGGIIMALVIFDMSVKALRPRLRVIDRPDRPRRPSPRIDDPLESAKRLQDSARKRADEEAARGDSR
jgi:hypothetical protein